MKTKRNLTAVFLAALCRVILARIAGVEEQAKGKVKTIDLDTTRSSLPLMKDKR